MIFSVLNFSCGVTKLIRRCWGMQSTWVSITDSSWDFAWSLSADSLTAQGSPLDASSKSLWAAFKTHAWPSKSPAVLIFTLRFHRPLCRWWLLRGQCCRLALILAPIDFLTFGIRPSRNMVQKLTYPRPAWSFKYRLKTSWHLPWAAKTSGKTIRL